MWEKISIFCHVKKSFPNIFISKKWKEIIKSGNDAIRIVRIIFWWLSSFYLLIIIVKDAWFAYWDNLCIMGTSLYGESAHM